MGLEGGGGSGGWEYRGSSVYRQGSEGKVCVVEGSTDRPLDSLGKAIDVLPGGCGAGKGGACRAGCGV